MRRAVTLLLVVWCAGCDLVGPSCVSRQERGTVTTFEGSVGANDITVHRVQYDSRGSQNDARFLWPTQNMTDGAQLRMYATRATCESFILPPQANSGDCAILASAGWSPGGVAPTVVITHGRGNPERLGNPPEYKLWVTSDRFTGYTVTITYFYGPDC